MKNCILTFFVCLASSLCCYSQPWTSSGTCDFTNGTQWNSGGSTPCACTWYSVEDGDTILNCAFGDCGQSDFFECIYDCNGHNGNPTDMVARQCDAAGNPTPICWYQGAGSTAGVDFCNGIFLPVEFIWIKGYVDEGVNIIEWATATEYNSSHFIIDRSSNGLEYEYMSTILSAGYSNTLKQYRAIDASPPQGNNYYRLTQYDFDGSYTRLYTIAINNTPKEVEKIIDITGKESNMQNKGVKIIIYKDGTTRKVNN